MPVILPCGQANTNARITRTLQSGHIIGIPAGGGQPFNAAKMLACLDVPSLGQPEVFIQVNEGLFNADGSIGA